jgi:hypothetical protein
MKKKFINGFLMVAMLFATTSSFVSCKDNVDDDLSDVYANLGKKSSELQDKITSVQNDLQNQINNIKPVIYEYGDTIINNITEIIQVNVDSICNDYNTKIDNINQNLEVINQQITNQTLAIDEINNALKDIDVRINNVGDSVNILWARVDSVIGILDAFVDGNLITGVQVNTTRNDVLGIINTPVAKVNALAAYYGTNDTGIDQFPYAGTAFNVGGRKLACYLEPNELPYDGFVDFESDMITDSYANAGQLYFTVNSTNYEDFDISKVAKIQIENSVGEVAPIQLNVRKSSAKINWNVFRAFLEETGKPADNGFYVADATIKEKDLDANRFGFEKFIDYKKLQKELKVLGNDMKNRIGENGSTTIKATFKNCLRESMSLVFDLMKNELTKTDLATNMSYSPQRLAFFAEKNGKMKRIAQTDDIDIFTTAVKPLSYNTFWEYEKAKDGNWILEDVLENAISKIANEINKRWGDKGIKAKIVSINDSEESVTIELNGKKETIIVSNAKYMKDLKDAIKVNGGLDAVNDKLAKLLKTYTLGTAVDQAENRINTWIDKASDMLTEWINKHLFTRALAPIIIFETDYGMDRLCEGMFVNRGIMHAYLTSGTLEVLAPAYKKYVALKKNGMLLQSEVLPGNTLVYDYDLSEKGDYTIILSCVDYFGYVITKKYNVHVK